MATAAPLAAQAQLVILESLRVAGKIIEPENQSLSKEFDPEQARLFFKEIILKRINQLGLKSEIAF